MGFTSADVTRTIQAIAAAIHEHRDYLTRLDNPIGDGDHGINMDRGFQAVLGKLTSAADQAPGAILKLVGTTLVSTVGGASGPLYGTAFLRAGMSLANETEFGPEQVVALFTAAVEGIQARGKAHAGEKTMLDALLPARDALQAALADSVSFDEALTRAATAAHEGMKATIPMLATKGRASYLGERSIGHQDPGATSAYLMLATAAGLPLDL
jgi:dihydroxyacetone kinase-like protein